MFKLFQCSGQEPLHQYGPKMAPKPKLAVASVYKFKVCESCHVSLGKKERPLKSSRNDFQRRKSPLTHVFSRIKCLADLTPLVRSMKRRRKARPGITTEQAKFNSPIKDCSSFNCTLTSQMQEFFKIYATLD